MDCIFLDRDGVINHERGAYTYKVSDFIIPESLIEVLTALKLKDFLLIVVTNQAGISRGLYTREDMKACHNFFQHKSDNLIDAFYYCPYHPTITESLARKPNTLMFEKAIYKYSINPARSWMIGDREKDMIPAKSLGINTVLINNERGVTIADYRIASILELLTIVR